MSSTAGFVSIFATIGTTRSPISGAQLLDVLRAAHERLGHQVDAQVERAREPLPVALGDRRQAQPLGRHVHALAERTVPPRTHFGPHDRAVDDGHRQLDRPVRQQDAVAGAQVVRETRIRGRRAVLVASPVGAQRERAGRART